MTTLADFKRAMKLGSVWKGFNHMLEREFSTRIVSIVQTNRFAFETQNPRGERVNSWCDFPKAKDLKFDGRIAQIYGQWNGEYRLILSYIIEN